MPREPNAKSSDTSQQGGKQKFEFIVVNELQYPIVYQIEDSVDEFLSKDPDERKKSDLREQLTDLILVFVRNQSIQNMEMRNSLETFRAVYEERLSSHAYTFDDEVTFLGNIYYLRSDGLVRFSGNAHLNASLTDYGVQVAEQLFENGDNRSEPEDDSPEQKPASEKTQNTTARCRLTSPLLPAVLTEDVRTSCQGVDKIPTNGPSTTIDNQLSIALVRAFETTAEEFIAISVSSSAGDPAIAIYDAQGRQIGSDDDGGPGLSSLYRNNDQKLKAGQYYLGLTSAFGDPAGTYNVQITTSDAPLTLDAPSLTPSLLRAERLEIDTEVKGQLGNQEIVDYFFAAEDNKDYKIEVVGERGTDTIIAVYNADGARIGGMIDDTGIDGSGRTVERKVVEAPRADHMFFIRVATFSGEAGQFKLKLTTERD